VRIGAALAGGALGIRVADTGIGIAPADLPKVFDSFSQIDSRLARRYEGAGLGLRLTRELVERHGGTIAIESKPGAGTTVTVTLPAARVMEAKPAPMAA
jgi:signal transduction histidine kinase